MNKWLAPSEKGLVPRYCDLGLTTSEVAKRRYCSRAVSSTLRVKSAVDETPAVAPPLLDLREHEDLWKWSTASLNSGNHKIFSDQLPEL